MNPSRFILTTALGIAITGTLAAQNMNPNGPMRPFVRGMLFAHMLHQADTDGDGRLSDAERAAARAKFEEKRTEFIAKHDTDGDGTLNAAERAAAREQITGRLQEAKGRLDTDGDGKLNAAERQAAREAFQIRRSKRPPHSRTPDPPTHRPAVRSGDARRPHPRHPALQRSPPLRVPSKPC